MSPTNERVVHYEWSHESPETVRHYNVKIFINGTLFSTAMKPNVSVNGATIVGQGKLHLEIEAVGLCGHTATHTIDENAFQCKCYCYTPVSLFYLLLDPNNLNHAI